MNLSKDDVPQLVRKIALPASIGFFFNTMFNVVDTFYAGRISTQAQAALSISFPVFFIIIALGNGVSNGVTALVSNAMGEGDKPKARLFAAQSLSFGVFLALALTFIGYLAAPALFHLLGAEDEYLTVALSYINVIFFGAFFFVMNMIGNGILQALGDTRTFRNALIIGFFANLVLDPCFIFGWWFFPEMGVAGIALATVIIQLIACTYVYSRALRTDLLDRRCLKHLPPRFLTFLDIARQGIPAGLNLMTVAIGIFIITYFVSWFGKEAVAAYGIATRIEQIAVLPTIGLNMATLTLVGHNNGAGLYDRVHLSLYTALKYGLVIISVGMIGVFVFSRQLMHLFTDDQKVIDIGAPYLRIAVFIFFAYLFLFINTSALQGVKRPLYGLWIGLYRQIVGPSIVYFLMASWFGLSGVWYGIVFVNWTAAFITILYTRHIMKNKLAWKPRPAAD